MSLVLLAAKRVTPLAPNGFGPLVVSTRASTTASPFPGTAIRKVARPATATPARTGSRAGAATGAVSSPPRGMTPSSQAALRTAATAPPWTTTGTTGDGSDPAMASSRTTVRACGPTTRPWPLGDWIGPLTPRTVRSTVTAFGPGLVRIRRSRRPGAPPPATSHEEAAAGIQAAVTSPRLSPLLTQERCVATVPGAIAPSPATSGDCAVEILADVVWPRTVTGSAQLPRVGRPLIVRVPALWPTARPLGKTDSGATAADTDT